MSLGYDKLPLLLGLSKLCNLAVWIVVSVCVALPALMEISFLGIVLTAVAGFLSVVILLCLSVIMETLYTILRRQLREIDKEIDAAEH